MGLDQVFFALPPGYESPWGVKEPPRETLLELRKFWPLVKHVGWGYGHASEEGANLPVSAIMELLQWASNPSAEYPSKGDGWFDEPEFIDSAMKRITDAIPTMLAKKAAGLDVWYVESH